MKITDLCVGWPWPSLPGLRRVVQRVGGAFHVGCVEESAVRLYFPSAFVGSVDFSAAA